MFTLKLYRRTPFEGGAHGPLRTLIFSVHHIETIAIGKNTDEIRAYHSERGGDYTNYYVGKREKDATALNSDNTWEWGLLENAEGKLSQHIRPHTYG